jgi:hypothetical protein
MTAPVPGRTASPATGLRDAGGAVPSVTDLRDAGFVSWTAPPEGRPLRLATADQDRPGLTSLFLLDGRQWRHLQRRTPQEMLEGVLGDAEVARALTQPMDRASARRFSVEG